MNEENNLSDDFHNNDPEEGLRIENELLQLKLQAQFGATTSGDSDAPPEIMNKFLKNVMAFETSLSENKTIKVYDKIGKPEFKRSSELNDEITTQALEQIIEILNQNKINVDFIGEYSDRLKYEFITEELFDHETDDIDVPGFTTNFIYEEFHPNHELDIKNRTMDFLNHWFDQRFNEYSSELAYTFILPDRQILKNEEVLEKMASVFDSYKKFFDCQFFIGEIKFELNEHGGMGHAEGGVKYKAVLENGEEISIEGPFKFYFSREYDYWSIFYFVFPGFEW